jgi:hypothetical protein
MDDSLGDDERADDHRVGSHACPVHGWPDDAFPALSLRIVARSVTNFHEGPTEATGGHRRGRAGGVWVTKQLGERRAALGLDPEALGTQAGGET